MLPVGGIKEKVLAAHRAGIRCIILPKDNERDLDDVPADLRDDIEFVFATHVDDVLNVALHAKPVPRRTRLSPALKKGAAAAGGADGKAAARDGAQKEPGTRKRAARGATER